MTDHDLDLPGLLELLAHSSTRPRYAFMVLNLIAQAASAAGRAGPYVTSGGAAVPVREWLCDALTPMGHRDPKRIKLTERVRSELSKRGILPGDPAQARQMVDQEVKARVRAAGKTNVSRSVSELVRAGLLHRHYQGYRVDHANRGAQRLAVYTVAPIAQAALKGPEPGLAA